MACLGEQTRTRYTITATVSDGANTAALTGIAAEMAVDGTVRAMMDLRKEPLTLVSLTFVPTGTIGGGMCCISVSSYSAVAAPELITFCECTGLCF